MDASGRPRSAKSAAAVPGMPGYVSESINPATGMTASGDVFNRFRGYVGPQGGTFGTPADRAGFESLSGVSADKLGDTSGYGDADWARVNRTFGGIANRDAATIDAGLSDPNAFVRRTAAAYKLGRGSEGLSDADFAKFEQGGIKAFDAPAPAAVAQPARARAPALEPEADPFHGDPFGQFAKPTDANTVITPERERAIRAYQEKRAMNNLQPNVLDPFAPFLPAPTAPQQGIAGPGIQAVGTQGLPVLKSAGDDIPSAGSGHAARAQGLRSGATDIGGMSPPKPTFLPGPEDSHLGPSGGLPTVQPRGTSVTPAFAPNLGVPENSPTGAGGIGGIANVLQGMRALQPFGGAQNQRYSPQKNARARSLLPFGGRKGRFRPVGGGGGTSGYGGGASGSDLGY